MYSMAPATPPAVDAWSIFAHTRSAVTGVQYPWRLDYTIAVSGLDGEKPVADHYRASCDLSDGTIKLFPISDEQLAAPPPVPHGFNVSISIAFYGGGFTIPVGHPAPYQDLIGEPLIAPTYMFGLRYSGVPYNVKPVGNEPTTLPVIATVSTQNRDYAVTLAGTAVLDGVAVYDLQLKPLRKPKDNRLRELWVGTSDYLPRKAVVAGNFTTAPLVDVRWTIDFTVANGTPYVTREAAQQTLYLAHRRIVRDAVVAFESMSEPGRSIYDQPLVAPGDSSSTISEP